MNPIDYWFHSEIPGISVIDDQGWLRQTWIHVINGHIISNSPVFSCALSSHRAAPDFYTILYIDYWSRLSVIANNHYYEIGWLQWAWMPHVIAFLLLICAIMAYATIRIMHMNIQIYFCLYLSWAAHQCVVSKCNCAQNVSVCCDCWRREPLMKWSTALRAHGFLASAMSRRPPTDLLHVTPPVCLPSPP